MSRTAKRTVLGIQRLEDRTVPATFGLPWANPNLTVSLVPDGTPILGGGTSNAIASLSKDQSFTAWETTLLSALQAWANVANVNFGMVSDTGSALGAAGNWQGDTRFGDIRLAGSNLGAGVLALTAPPDPSAAGTRGGDMVLNTAMKFGGPGSYNLMTVALQEAGHALGLDNSSDPASVMYTTYTTVKTGLAASDVAAIQALYGPRKADQFEGATGNETSAAASVIRPAAAGASKSSVVVYGDLAAATDTDVYSFTTPDDGKKNTVTVKVQTGGLSLANAKLTIYRLDGKGNEADAKTVTMDAAVIGGGSATVTFDGKDDKGPVTWYARVTDATGTKFPVGRYALGVGFDDSNFASADLNALAGSSSGVVNVDAATNDTFASAAALAANYASGPVTRSVVDGSISATDVDYYKATAPTGGTVLTAGVYGFSTTSRVDVLDAAGNPVPATVTANSNGAYTVQATGLTAGATYTLKVTGQTADGYHLTADFGGVASTAQTLSQGSISGGGAAVTNTLYVGRTETLSLTLASTAAAGAPDGVGTRLTIFNAAGAAVQTLTTWDGDTTGVSGILLGAGTYTVKIETIAPIGFTGPVGFLVRGVVLDDPIGLAVSNPGTVSTGAVPVYTYPGLVSTNPFIWQMF